MVGVKKFGSATSLKKNKQSAASGYHRSALLPGTLNHTPNVRILKLRKPDRPSGRKQEN